MAHVSSHRRGCDLSTDPFDLPRFCAVRRRPTAVIKPVGIERRCALTGSVAAVFQCGQCKTVIGDSLSVVSERTEGANRLPGTPRPSKPSLSCPCLGYLCLTPALSLHPLGTLWKSRCERRFVLEHAGMTLRYWLSQRVSCEAKDDEIHISKSGDDRVPMSCCGACPVRQRWAGRCLFSWPHHPRPQLAMPTQPQDSARCDVTARPAGQIPYHPS